MLQDLDLPAQRGDVVLRLLQIDGQVGAALARCAGELVERVLQRLGPLGLLGGQLVALHAGGVDFLFQLGAQVRDILAHLLPFLRRRHARHGSHGEPKQKRGGS